MMWQAEKRAVFPTLSAPIPPSFFLVASVSSLSNFLKTFFPEKRQKEGTPFYFLKTGLVFK